MADTVNISAPTGAYGITEQSNRIIRKKTITNAEALAVKGSAIAAGDVIQCIPVYGGEIVTGVRLVVNAPGAASSTLIVGDGANDDGYMTTIDCTSAAGTMYSTSNGAYAGGKIYATSDTEGHLFHTDDTVDITVGGTVFGTTFSMDLLVEIIPYK